MITAKIALKQYLFFTLCIGFVRGVNLLLLSLWLVGGRRELERNLVMMYTSGGFSYTVTTKEAIHF
jgi:hypothetical protein